jgi:hypothetical protein
MLGVPELMEPGTAGAVEVGEDEPDFWAAAAAIPPTAAPAIRAAMAIFFDRPACGSGSVFVSVRVAEADDPFQDAVTRMRNGPAMLLGRKARPAAAPSGRV